MRYNEIPSEYLQFIRVDSIVFDSLPEEVQESLVRLARIEHDRILARHRVVQDEELRRIREWASRQDLVGRPASIDIHSSTDYPTLTGLDKDTSEGKCDISLHRIIPSSPSGIRPVIATEAITDKLPHPDRRDLDDEVEIMSLSPPLGGDNNKTKILKKFTVGKYLEKELNFISKINSPNIVTIESTVCYNTKLIGYIMETLEDSKEIFKQNTQINKKIIQIINGLIDIHEKNISHCDIKLENIMVDKEGKIKIIDFGSAEWLESIAKPKTTEPFIPPEARDKELVVKESYDVYSFGMLLAQILSENIYQGLDEKILQDKKYGHIIQKCLDKDFDKRPSLKFIKSELEKITNK